MGNVLITGTTSGLGKAFTEKFASMGNNIILVSRDIQKLKKQQLYCKQEIIRTYSKSPIFAKLCLNES